MADSEYDPCPSEQKLRVAGHILIEGEKEAAEAFESLLLSLADPSDLPVGTEFYAFRQYSDVDARTALTRRAARAGIAVLLGSDGMKLPLHIGVAYNMPDVGLMSDMARFIADAAPEIENEANLRASAEGLQIADRHYIKPMRDLSNRAAALLARLQQAEGRQ